MSTAKSSGSRLGWLGGSMLASGAILLGLKSADAINATTTYILMCIPIGLMIAFFIEVRRRQDGPARANSAAVRYMKGIFATSLGYMLGLGIAIWTWNNVEVSTGVTWFLAMLPIAPILAMVFVMGRYVVEEKDEYLRERFIMASLIGLGCVLSIGSFYGFLETFELVPHVPGWWAVPIWAMGMGLGQCWMNWRDRAQDADDEDEGEVA